MSTTFAPTQTVSSPEAEVLADLREQAATRLYDAESVMHAANRSHVEAWIIAADGKLHAAVEAYTRAAAMATSISPAASDF